MSLTRVTTARQDPYDAIPRSVQARDDLPYGAKCLYGALNSAANLGRHPSYQQLADHLGASVRSVIRWVARLVQAGLIAVRRRGQGLVNLFTVLGLVTSGGDTLSRPEVTTGQARPRSPFLKKQDGRTGTYPRIQDDPARWLTGPYGRYIHH